GELSGWYQRQVVYSRDGGIFKCGVGRYQTSTRFELSGHRTGDSIVITETGYHAEPNPCDSRSRRLVTYQGSIASSGNEVILRWGSGGNEVLRRLQGAASPGK